VKHQFCSCEALDFHRWKPEYCIVCTGRPCEAFDEHCWTLADHCGALNDQCGALDDQCGALDDHCGALDHHCRAVGDHCRAKDGLYGADVSTVEQEKNYHCEAPGDYCAITSCMCQGHCSRQRM
jgi:hypothetical protein